METEQQCLGFVRQVLTGELTRSEYLTRSTRMQTYANIAILLARHERYLGLGNRVKEPLEHIFNILLAVGAETESQRRRYGGRLVNMSRSLKLHSSEAGAYPRHVFLSPTGALAQLVEEHRDNPAIDAFIQDAEQAWEIEKAMAEEWRNYTSAESKAADLRMRIAQALQIEEHHGKEGLQALLKVIQARLSSE